MMMLSIQQQQQHQKLYDSPNSHSPSTSSLRSLIPSSSVHTPNSTSPSSNQLNSTKLEGIFEFPPYNKPISIESTAPPSPPRTTVNTLTPISNLATFAGEMISWIWFKSSVKGKEVSRNQAVPSEKFLRFCHEVLATTQVSRSVVVLALLFIHKLKTKNSIEGALGSEFRLATTAFMIANKILDDNTYTAKTWAEVSSLELLPLVTAEAEFLKGLDFQLHATENEYNNWTKLLEGHVATRRSLLRQSDTRRTGSILNENNVARIGRPLVGLGLSGGVTYNSMQSQELELRRHSAVEQRYPALYNFSFPPRHSSLSHVTSCTPSTINPVYAPIEVSQVLSTLSSHTRTRSYPPPIQNPTPSSKRRVSDAFADEEVLHQVPKKAMMSWGSYSVGSSPQQPTFPLQSSSMSEFVFPSNPSSTADSTLQYKSGSFHHLVDPFSPVYAPNRTQIRHENLSFYSLAAGQRLPRQALPLDPIHFSSQPLSYNTTPNYQSSTTRYHSLSPNQIPQYQVSPYRTSPSHINNRTRQSQSPLYSPARSVISRSPTDYYSSTPPHSGYGVIPHENQPVYYSQFSNAIPAVHWPQVLASQ